MRLTVGGVSRTFDPEALVVIGYAGRDRAAVEHHIEELAALGVPRPASVPLVMVFAPWLICQKPQVTVAGSDTSGEAEIVLVVDGDEVFVTVGSDHTDRALEALDIEASKAVCPKPVGLDGVALSSVAGRWDELRLRSWIDGPAVGGADGADKGVVYQDGSAGLNIDPLALVDAIDWADSRPDCFVVFTGTVPVLGGIRPSGSFSAELSGPGLTPVTLSYEVVTVPAAS